LLNGDDDLDVGVFQTVTASRWRQILGYKKSVFVDEGLKIPNLGRAVRLLVDSRPEIQVICTATVSTISPDNYDEFCAPWEEPQYPGN